MNKEIYKYKFLIRKILIVSLTINLLFIVKLSINSINEPEDKYGILKYDVKVGLRTEGDREFTDIILPKGIAVRNASPRGFKRIALFEPNWFQITITSDEEDLVDYSNNKKESFAPSIYPCVKILNIGAN